MIVAVRWPNRARPKEQSPPVPSIPEQAPQTPATAQTPEHPGPPFSRTGFACCNESIRPTNARAQTGWFAMLAHTNRRHAVPSEPWTYQASAQHALRGSADRIRPRQPETQTASPAPRPNAGRGCVPVCSATSWAHRRPGKIKNQ